MSKVLLVAILTEATFLLGEIPAVDYLKTVGFTAHSVDRPWFWLFTITRFIGIAGQFYLWSATELGRVSALTGCLGIIMSNLLGIFILHQQTLSPSGYLGLGLAIASVLLLSH
ncbi:MAG: hypothetical protein AB4352_10200 [Hormoscilla sp.]